MIREGSFTCFGTGRHARLAPRRGCDPGILEDPRLFRARSTVFAGRVQLPEMPRS